MVTIVSDVFGLERNSGMVVTKEDCLARLKNRDTLSMNRGGVEHKHRSGGTREFDYVGEWQLADFGLAQIARVLLSVASLDELECTRAHIGKIEAQFDLPVDRFF